MESEKPIIKAKTDGTTSTKSSQVDDTNSNENYPESCKTNKEKECWKLFQKMLNKGINVSYDTILRGMLTPTELRARQKQKELEESQRIQMEEKLNEDKKPA